MGIPVKKAATGVQEWDLLTIGEVAERTGKSVRALHYYEEMGLIRPHVRSQGGFRLFTEHTVRQVEYISKLQAAGISLAAIKEMAGILGDGGTGGEASEKLKAALQHRLDEVRGLIRGLVGLEAEMTKALEVLTDCKACALKPALENCQICGARAKHPTLPPIMEAFLS